MPMCFSVDLEPKMNARKIIIERHRTSYRRTCYTKEETIVPVVLAPPPPPPSCAWLEPAVQYKEAQVVLAEPPAPVPAPSPPQQRPAILGLDINHAASNIAERLAAENMRRNQVALRDNDAEEEWDSARSEGSSHYNEQIREILDAREERRSRSQGPTPDDFLAEESARRRIRHEFRRSASPRTSGERICITTEGSPRSSGDRLVVVAHTRQHTHGHHENRHHVHHDHTHHHHHRHHRCPVCDGQRALEAREDEPEFLQIPERRVKYWRVPA